MIANALNQVSDFNSVVNFKVLSFGMLKNYIKNALFKHFTKRVFKC